MPAFRRFLSRRWRFAFLGAAAIFLGLVMLHPYPRQSLFGPTIHGKPWCYWEDAIRLHATHRREDAKRSALEKKIREWLGTERRAGEAFWYFRFEEMLPVFLALAKDNDVDVREYVMASIVSYEDLYQEPALPILREALQHKEPLNRIYAAKAVWRVNKDKQVIPILSQILKEPIANQLTMRYNREYALEVLGEIALDLPEIFPDVVAFATHKDERLRWTAMSAMQRFGKKGMPTLLKGLEDRDEGVRAVTARALEKMGTEARTAMPALERMLHEKDENVRSCAVKALIAIDGERYLHLKMEFNAGEWSNFADPKNAFNIDMPGQARSDVKGDSFGHVVEVAYRSYAVHYFDVKNARRLPAQQRLDAAQKDPLLLTEGDKVESEVNVTHHGFPGRELLIVNEEKGNLVIRFLLVEDRTYVFSAGGPRYDLTNHDVRRFFSSFRVGNE